MPRVRVWNVTLGFLDRESDTEFLPWAPGGVSLT